MSCNAKISRNYDIPKLSEFVRFILGVMMLLTGIYLLTLNGIQEYVFSLLLFLAVPSVILRN